MNKIDLFCLVVAQEYADAYRNWHVTKDYSADSMKRLRTAKEALLKAFPPTVS
jgi:hypothetical protein